MESGQSSNVLHCARCAYSWVPRKGQIPQRCPRCRSIKWNMPFLNLMCKRCGYQWNSHNGTPKRCPKCGTHQWNVAPRIFTCKRCGNTWIAKGTNVPKRCPACSCREWDKDPADNEVYRGGRRSNRVDEEIYSEIVHRYNSGQNCLNIAMAMSIPFSVVYSTVRENSEPNRQINV